VVITYGQYSVQPAACPEALAGAGIQRTAMTSRAARVVGMVLTVLVEFHMGGSSLAF
jgi:hypothetical protein